MSDKFPLANPDCWYCKGTGWCYISHQHNTTLLEEERTVKCACVKASNGSRIFEMANPECPNCKGKGTRKVLIGCGLAPDKLHNCKCECRNPYTDIGKAWRVDALKELLGEPER